MGTERNVFRAGEYFLAVEGFAMMRHLITDTPRAQKRTEDVLRIVQRFDEFPQTLEYFTAEHGVEEGYTAWAPNYDGPNPAIERETPIVDALLDELRPGDALDAACGTGRHAAALAARGHHVIGVDATEAMLAIARKKVPSADFRIGKLEALPVDDASIDVITCALALTHVDDLPPVMHEFARVLRSGGRAIISDMHPFIAATSGVAAFPAPDGSRGVPFVLNRVHGVSDYVNAFLAAGLRIEECLEPPVTDDMLERFPTYAAIPEATSDAFGGMPYLLIWVLSR